MSVMVMGDHEDQIRNDPPAACTGALYHKLL